VWFSWPRFPTMAPILSLSRKGMFAGERRDQSKVVKGVETRLPEEEEKPASDEEVGVSDNSENEKAGVCCALGKGNNAEDIFSFWGGVFRESKVGEKNNLAFIHVFICTRHTYVCICTLSPRAFRSMFDLI
jgi:hypothetical protein